MIRPTLNTVEDFDERWLTPGGLVPVDMPTTGALVREIQRLRKDAARYRYLRDGNGFKKSGLFVGHQGEAGIIRASLDYADNMIDAAIIDGDA